MKIILFYSSIGQGHISAAQAIAREILRQDPGAVVVQKDIRAFMDPVRRVLDEKLYWFVAKNLPELFDHLFASLQEQGNNVGTIAVLSNDYHETKVWEYIKAESPDVIIATHYGSAQVLGTLREKGLLPGIKIGWLHTDYFEGYFPRISQRIDRTFLAHPELESRWLQAGVAPELIETTGMPVNIPAADGAAGRECLGAIGFDPAVKTVTIACGKEGAGDFVGVVAGLAELAAEPLQVIAICGKNDKQRRALERLKRRLPFAVRLQVLGFIPQTDVVSYIRSSDLFITKAGGLSPAEAFTLGKPTILLNVISGHERENAELFSQLGMADFNTDVQDLGRQAWALLADPERQEAMLQAQREFRDNMDIGRIARFALDPAIAARTPENDFGVEKGVAAGNVAAALAQLENDAPADMELLLSYSTSQKDEPVALENPFGHIALRIGKTVYSSNHMDQPAGATLLQHLSLAEYLFGVEPPPGKQEHTSTYGMSYGRDTLGFRIKGVAPAALKRMHAEAERIERDFREDRCRWDRVGANCADFVVQILRAGGFDTRSMAGPISIVAMPLDVFDKVRYAFADADGYRTELVAYRRLTGSQASYRFSRFPLSLGQPARSLALVLKKSHADPLEQSVGRQLTGYFGDDRVYYEDLRKRLSTSTADDLGRSRRSARSMERVLMKEMKQLLVARPRMQVDAYRRRIEQLTGRQTLYLIERCYDMARLSTEHAEAVLNRQSEDTLQTAFRELMGEYAALDLRELSMINLSKFIVRLAEFHDVMERAFAEAGQRQNELVAEIKTAYRKIERRFRETFTFTAFPGTRVPPAGTDGRKATALMRPKGGRRKKRPGESL